LIAANAKAKNEHGAVGFRELVGVVGSKGFQIMEEKYLHLKVLPFSAWGIA